MRLRALQRIGTEAKLAFRRATGAWGGLTCHVQRPIWLERGSVLSDARREVVLVGATKSQVAVADAALASLGKIQQQEHICHELLRAGVERGPSRRSRDP